MTNAVGSNLGAEAVAWVEARDCVEARQAHSAMQCADLMSWQISKEVSKTLEACGGVPVVLERSILRVPGVGSFVSFCAEGAPAPVLYEAVSRELKLNPSDEKEEWLEHAKAAVTCVVHFTHRRVGVGREAKIWKVSSRLYRRQIKIRHFPTSTNFQNDFVEPSEICRFPFVSF